MFRVWDSKHHVHTRAASDRLEAHITESLRLITLDDKVDVWDGVRTCWWSIGPAGWSEPKNAGEVRFQGVQVGLEVVELDVAKWDKMHLRLVSVRKLAWLTSLGSSLRRACSSGSS